MSKMASESSTYNLVSSHYTEHLTSPPNSSYSSVVAASFGYTPADLASIPTSANLGVSCGNPIATANLKPGETLLDLGCGAGLDVFLASSQLGPTGRAIGVDMTIAMLEKAKQNCEKGGYENVEFRLGNITDLPVSSGSVDIVVSNCVINLVPAEEKHKVFKEVFRVLKPGGRVAISDLLMKQELPQEVREDVGLYVGCVAGASRTEEYEGWLKGVGFDEVAVVDTKKDVNVYKEGIMSVEVEGDEKSVKGGCCGGGKGVDFEESRKERIEKLDLNQYVGSYQIYALKQ